MAKNPFGKSRPVSNPFAIYKMGDWTWHVCKTYKSPEAEAKDVYARWFVWAKSPNTYGEFEGGDTYVKDVTRYATPVAAEPAWLEAQGIHAKMPTPAEYLARD